MAIKNCRHVRTPKGEIGRVEFDRKLILAVNGMIVGKLVDADLEESYVCEGVLRSDSDDIVIVLLENKMDGTLEDEKKWLQEQMAGG